MSKLTQTFGIGWRRFLASLGIGAAQITVSVVGEREHSRGSQVSGVVTVTGGDVSQQIVNLTVCLQGSSTHSGDWHRQPTPRRLASNQHIQARERQDFSFSLSLPENNVLSVSNPSAASIVVSLSLAGMFGTLCVSYPLRVVLQPEITAFLQAFPRLHFQETSWYLHHLTRPDSNLETTAVFYPPNRLQKHLASVTIYVRTQGKRLVGKLLFVLRDENRHIECPVQIPRAELITADLHPNPEGAIPYLNQSIAFALALPEEPETWMLRPAQSPPTDPETLLRPTMPDTSAASDDLLRPTTPPNKSKF